MPSADNKRIAKNTLFLYVRMIILMLVKLYTSRVLLSVLGIDDYGIWNVVAAFVISFSFISSPLVTATQRFLNFDMGKGATRVNKVFNISLELFFIIGFFIVLILETFGVWFINHKMNFFPNRIVIVNVVFQFTILTFFTNFIRMAYESALVASEKMSFYALNCIIEAILLLGIAFLLQLNLNMNLLIAYSMMTTIVTVINFFCYQIYCKKKLNYTHIKLCWDKKLVKEIGTFSAWNLFGGLASMTSNQGLNVLINIFFGVAVNAAYGISMQIRGAVSVILDNILKAANPQITQSYASGNLMHMNTLLINILKISFTLCLALIIPIIINLDFLLHLWLGNNIPTYTQQFAILTLIQLLIVSIGNPIDVAVFSTGNIRSYQLWLSAILFFNIVLSYIFFKVGKDAVWAFTIKCCVEIVIISVRFVFLKIRLNFNMSNFFKRTILPILSLTIVVVIAMFGITQILPFGKGWYRLGISLVVFIPTFLISTWFIIPTANQRTKAIKLIKTRLYSKGQ